MKKFLLQGALFLLCGLIIAEIVIRVFGLTIDVPEQYLTKNKLLRYYPHQTGRYVDGHTWQVNQYGYPGIAPKSLDNLVTIIGDSYIASFMNDDSCHQNVYLKKMLPQYNYFEAGRAGAEIFEMLENAKALDSLAPKFQLIYVKNSDFVDGIKGMAKIKTHVSLDLDKNQLVFAKFKKSWTKKAVYNWKFAYYFYRNVWLAKGSKAGAEGEEGNEDSRVPVPYDKLPKELDFIKANYDMRNKVFVFDQYSDDKLVKACQDAGITTLKLDDSNDKSWGFEHDRHWTCYGHQQAAKQVKAFLEKVQPDSQKSQTTVAYEQKITREADEDPLHQPPLLTTGKRVR